MKRLVFALMLAAATAAFPQEKGAKDSKAAAQATDPVCGMTVDPKTSEKAVYKGKTYYFCSREEKQSFEKTPEKFLAKKK